MFLLLKSQFKTLLAHQHLFGFGKEKQNSRLRFGFFPFSCSDNTNYSLMNLSQFVISNIDLSCF